ncbi:MAG: hypothetical protein LBP51_00135 [Deferribacteraceae bacterium]|jgi:type II restriction enzyme|nr:hypothetical protein [Deferribacteraceae bacterium]
MTGEDLINLYEEKKKLFKDDAYRHISSILKEAKAIHKEGFAKEDHDQSWRSFKGKNFEKLLIHIIREEVHKIGFELFDKFFEDLKKLKG